MAITKEHYFALIWILNMLKNNLRLAYPDAGNWRCQKYVIEKYHTMTWTALKIVFTTPSNALKIVFTTKPHV